MHFREFEAEAKLRWAAATQTCRRGRQTVFEQVQIGLRSRGNIVQGDFLACKMTPHGPWILTYTDPTAEVWPSTLMGFPRDPVLHRRHHRRLRLLFALLGGSAQGAPYERGPDVEELQDRLRVWRSPRTEQTSRSWGTD